MEFFENTRLKIGNSIFSRSIARSGRKSVFGGISEVKKIGIVWDASRTAEFAALSKFHQKMLERNIDVNILGYFPGKELPDQYTAIRFLTCIRRKELSFFYIPISPEAEHFMKTKFDVLIDINFNRIFQLRYITGLSKASFKTGLFCSDNDSSTFDLMMEMKKPVAVEDYLTQIIFYLEKINSGSQSIVANQ